MLSMRATQMSGMKASMATPATAMKTPAIDFDSLRHHITKAMVAMAIKAPREWLPSAATALSTMVAISSSLTQRCGAFSCRKRRIGMIVTSASASSLLPSM